MTRRSVPRSPGLSTADPFGLDRVRRLPPAPELSTPRGGARRPVAAVLHRLAAYAPEPLLPPEPPPECPREQDPGTGCAGCPWVITDEEGEFLGCVVEEQIAR